jgi:hypothetical protein
MNVLMLGRNEMMLAMGAAPFIDAGHQVTTTLSDSEAAEMLRSGTFPALVFGMAVEQSSRSELKKFLLDNQINAKVLEPLSPMDLPQLLDELS